VPCRAVALFCCGRLFVRSADTGAVRVRRQGHARQLWRVDDTRSGRQLRTTGQLHVCRPAWNAQRQLSPGRFMRRKEMVCV